MSTPQRALSMTRRLMASAALVSLAAAAVACTESFTDADKSSVSTSVAEGALEDASEADEGKSVELQTADGNTVLVPAGVGSAVTGQESEWGKPQAVMQSGIVSIVTFANGDRLIYSEETGAVELLGMIGLAWDDEGGAEAAVGLPIEPEEKTDKGWSQRFQHGVITYEDDGSGVFITSVEMD